MITQDIFNTPMMVGCMLKSIWDWLGQNVEQIVALAALAIAFGSFWAQRRHNRLSVKPHLFTFTEREYDKKHAVVYLQNNGFGPALIKSYEFLLDGKKKSDGSSYEASELVSKLLPDINCSSTRTQLGADYCMPANASVVIFGITLNSEETTSLIDIQKRFDRCDLIVRYESFYGQKFVLDTTNNPLSN